MNASTSRVALMAGICLFPLSAVARYDPVTPQSFARTATLIGIGVVETVTADSPHSGTACARIANMRWLRGPAAPAAIGVCYTTRRHIELGPGPAVVPGEEVLVFGSQIDGDRITLADEHRGLVSPSNFPWTSGTYQTGIATFGDFRDATVLAIRFVDGAPGDRDRMISDLVAMDNWYVWHLLGWEVGHSEFDHQALARAVLGRATVPNARRASALRLLEDTNRVPDVRRRFENELLDACLDAMGDQDPYVRKTALAIAMGNAVMMRFERPRADMEPRMVPHLGEEDFGYDPDGTEEERTTALERWRAWWAENRGKGRYDRSEAVIAAEIEQERTRPQRMAEHRRALGEALKTAIDVGRRTPESLTADQQESLLAAGWEVTPDGRVVPAGTMDAGAGETADAAQADGEGADAGEDEQAGGGPAEQRPKGCGGCAAAGDAQTGAVVTIAALVLLLSAGQWRRRP